MANPFEGASTAYLVLVNDEGRHSLWPAFAGVPEGWKVAYGKDTRDACLRYVERNWTDMRPNSLTGHAERAEPATS
ncbi:MbtH family protein [Streptomyces sp. B6B3]|uniref:MbtH family protein n=1 Tax=Streptomyces sp. B6B3 TaxID=3153570 RepID=UPI00325DAFE1